MHAKHLIVFVIAVISSARADTTDVSKVSTHETVGFGIARSPNKTAEWTSQPTIVICKNAPTSTGAVESAVSWWRLLGYRFWMTVPSSIHYGCLFGEPDGNILIRLIDNRGVDPNNLATTYLYYNKDSGEILWAEILLRGEPRERVLEHELGHALGWRHYSRRSHIMHPVWINSGWDSSGLRNY